VPVSVVIPARDEAASLPELLASLEGQGLRPSEVVLVDAGSTDGTAEVAAAAGSELRVRVVRIDAATPGRARNEGVAHCAEPWLCFVDAGTRVHPGWLEALWGVVEAEPEVEVVFSSWEVAPVSAFEEGAVIACLPGKRRVGERLARYPTIPGCLVRAETFAATGGFPDLRASEDLTVLERLREIGAREAVAPDARYTWTFVSGPRALWRRYRLYAEHNVYAGRQRTWHHGVARSYAVAGVFLLLGAAVHPVWLLVVVAGLGARVVRRAAAHRAEHSWWWLLAPHRVVWTAFAMLIVDGATFAGWLDAVRNRGR
jgi:glycosyltransferase involved in cell wall biosynthesis